MGTYRRDKLPPSAAERHLKAFKEHPQFKDIALFITNAWGQGLGDAQSCILLGLEALYETCAEGRPTLEVFAEEFEKLLGEKVKRPRTDAEIEAEEAAMPEEADEEEETFEARMARLAAEAKLKPKRRRKS